MLQARSRVSRIMCACMALVVLAFVATLSPPWRIRSSDATSYFSVADVNGGKADGRAGRPEELKPHIGKSVRSSLVKLKETGLSSEENVKMKRQKKKNLRFNDGNMARFNIDQRDKRKEDFSIQREAVSEEDEEVKVESTAEGRNEKVLPFALTGLVSNWNELKGRHSDYITAQCGNNSFLPLSKAGDQKYGFIGPFSYLRNYKNPCWLSQSATKILCVPYFYLIGAPKAGSTDVFWRIKGHSHVTSGKAKEVRWFDRQRFSLEKGKPAAMPRFEDYLEFFERPTRYVQNATVRIKNGTIFHHRVIADGSPTYYYSSFNWRMMPGNERCHAPRVTAMSYIHHLWPDSKLILVLRNPVTRLFSTYLYNTHLPGFNTSAAQFDLWVKESMDSWFRCLGEASFRHCMYERQVIYDSAISTFAAGIYSRYVLDLLKLFPRKQIYFVHLESYSTDIKNTLKEIFAFLQLPALPEEDLARISKKDERKRNRGKNYAAVPDMWPSTRKLLEHFYAPYNAELSAILDNDPKWLWL